jgi:hypothetical protein
LRSLTALAAALTGLGVLAVSVSGGVNPALMGRRLFLALALPAMGVSLLAGPILTADCLCEEKRLGTIGLLFLTNMRGYDIVAGKLSALMMPAIHCLLAIMPILGMCFFMGGVTRGEFFRTALVLGNTMLFSLAVSMLVSAFCEDGRKALAGSAAVIFGAAVAIPGAAVAWSGGFPVGSALLRLSPAYTAWLTPAGNFGGAWKLFAGSLILSQVLSWAFLVAAGLCLPHTWQDRPVRRKLPGWLAWCVGWEARRARRRVRKEKLLDLNPILWLAERNRRSALAVWLFLAGSMAFWLGGYYCLSHGWFGAGIVFVVVYGLHGALKVWVAWEASRRFAEDRNSGALELLLCTPLKEENLWQGWLIHLRRRFLAPVAALAFIDFMLMDGGLQASSWWGGNGTWGVGFIAGMGLFISDTYALCWVGLWQGLTAKNSTRACLNCVLYILVLPAAGCLGVLGVAGLLSTTGTAAPFGMVVAFWFAVGFLVDFACCGSAMAKLSRDFRAASIYGIARRRSPVPWWRGDDQNPGGGDYRELAADNPVT